MLTALLAIVLGTSIFAVSIGQATVIWKALHSITEKPEASGKILTIAAIGLGMLESLVLYAMITFMLTSGIGG